MDTPPPDPTDGQADPFGPPAEPCECYCLHCRRVFMSDGIWYQSVVNGPPGETGFWLCPTANCSGSGFTFDIFPTDPAHPANEGWSFGDDDEEFDDDDDDAAAAEPDADREYDPAEPKYAGLAAGDDDGDDLEGEEWKHGLQPGEQPPDPPHVAAARAEFEAEERQYDEPDRRPRTIDGSTWKADPAPPGPSAVDGDITEDDIPF